MKKIKSDFPLDLQEISADVDMQSDESGSPEIPYPVPSLRLAVSFFLLLVNMENYTFQTEKQGWPESISLLPPIFTGGNR